MLTICTESKDRRVIDHHIAFLKAIDECLASNENEFIECLEQKGFNDHDARYLEESAKKLRRAIQLAQYRKYKINLPSFYKYKNNLPTLK